MDKEQVTRQLIQQFRQKAIGLHLKANRTKQMILGTLILSTAIFIFAEQLSNQKKNTEFADLKASLRDQLLTLPSVYERMERASHIHDSTVDLISSFVASRDLDGISREVGNILDIKTNFRRDSMEINYVFKLTSVLMDRFEKFRAESQQLNIDFFSTLSTRIGAILILIFVAQILLRWYRYDVRLANYYNARADALELYLSDSQNMAFDKIINLFSPDIYDIGSPKSPTESMVGLLNAIRANGK